MSLPEAAIQFGYRVGESGEFTDNGTLDVLDERTGKRMPKTHFELDGDQATTTLYVTWRDKRGEEAGIFPISFDPDAELKAGQKSILKDTASSWIAFREYEGLLVYFSHLMSYRCAIKSVRYGLDGAPPDTAYPLPPCDPDNPYALPADVRALREAAEGHEIHGPRRRVLRRRAGGEDVQGEVLRGRSAQVASTCKQVSWNAV